MPAAAAATAPTRLDRGLDPLCAERRAAPRARVAWRVQLRHGAEELVAHTADVSIGGMFLETPGGLPTGAQLHVRFAVGAGASREEVASEAVVVRRVPPEEARRRGVSPGVGIAFTRFLGGEEAFAESLRLLLGRPVAGLTPSRVPESREAFPPTRIDELFLAAAAEWATQSTAAAAGEPALATADGCGSPVTAATPSPTLDRATDPPSSPAVTTGTRLASAALALSGMTAVALLLLFVGRLLQLV
jgi:hypothetical protein